MALTEAELKSLIVLQVGDDAAGTLAASIDLLWSSHADTSAIGLVALLTKRDAIDVMLAKVRNQVSFKALNGASVSASDMFDHLWKMRELIDAQIEAAQSGADGAFAIGELITVAPLGADSARGANPNARQYRGDPLRRRGDGRP
jgi:hypothetical protein